MPRPSSRVLCLFLAMAESRGWFDAETAEERRAARGDFWVVMLGPF